MTSIPAAFDDSRLGARGFPLGLGVLLGMLGLALFAGTFFGAKAGEHTEIVSSDGEPTPKDPLRVEIWAVGMTVLLLVAYAALLKYTGFIIATGIVTAVAIGPVLGMWRPRLIAGMSLGMSLGIYVVFGKLLGVYLPYGKVVNLAF